eukprot:TRINITY_DN4490_c0_g4_i2.p1 TRINITY_DN4490_c0_g4~~TRINITY_DN4490_c0_g4_i2.p1  ORF type:complete len:515 (+),score=179.07 TRINITY_DN4490_c0_g4_i2:116-1660(+)
MDHQQQHARHRSGSTGGRRRASLHVMSPVSAGGVFAHSPATSMSLSVASAKTLGFSGWSGRHDNSGRNEGSGRDGTGHAHDAPHSAESSPARVARVSHGQRVRSGTVSPGAGRRLASTSASRSPGAVRLSQSRDFWHEHSEKVVRKHLRRGHSARGPGSSPVFDLMERVQEGQKDLEAERQRNKELAGRLQELERRVRDSSQPPQRGVADAALTALQEAESVSRRELEWAQLEASRVLRVVSDCTEPAAAEPYSPPRRFSGGESARLRTEVSRLRQALSERGPGDEPAAVRHEIEAARAGAVAEIVALQTAVDERDSQLLHAAERERELRRELDVLRVKMEVQSELEGTVPDVLSCGGLASSASPTRLARTSARRPQTAEELKEARERGQVQVLAVIADKSADANGVAGESLPAQEGGAGTPTSKRRGRSPAARKSTSPRRVRTPEAGRRPRDSRGQYTLQSPRPSGRAVSRISLSPIPPVRLMGPLSARRLTVGSRLSVRSRTSTPAARRSAR